LDSMGVPFWGTTLVILAMILLYTYEGGVKNLAVYSPDQLKSVFNVGAFGQRPVTAEEAERLGMTEEEAQAAQEEGDIRLSLRSLVSNAMTPSVTKTINKIAPPTYNPNLWERILNTISGDSFTKLRAETINRYERLADIDRAVAKQIKQAGGVEQLADQKAESAALFSDLGAGLLETAMGANDKFGGVPVFRNGITVIDNFNRTVKGPILIFKPLADLKDPDVFRLWQVWKSVQRAKRLDVEGRENLIDAPDIKAIELMEKQNPNLIKIFKLVDKDWTAYNDKLVKYMVDTGVITPQMAKKWTEHGDYFPFYRLVDFNDVQGPKMFSSLANVRPPKKLKGGESPLGDIFENIVRNSQAAIQAGIKNVAAQRATQQALRIQQVTRLPAKRSGPNVYRVMENGREVLGKAL
ncbi:hypothetical protein EBT31_20750, partial [bacterium]|nr:hypothetical protein [bacterium]